MGQLKKKSFTLALALLLILSMSACGKDKTESSSSEGASVSEPQVASVVEENINDPGDVQFNSESTSESRNLSDVSMEASDAIEEVENVDEDAQTIGDESVEVVDLTGGVSGESNNEESQEGEVVMEGPNAILVQDESGGVNPEEYLASQEESDQSPAVTKDVEPTPKEITSGDTAVIGVDVTASPVVSAE